MARVDTLGHFLTDVADAIRTKTGSSESIVASNFDTEIENIPSGGSSDEPTVFFYDYDGTVLYSYTKSEFLALSSMPENPTHTGLTSQGWNYSLADAQSYVQECGALDIGQMYNPSDGKTHLFVTLSEDFLSPAIGVGVNGVVTIDWGDGTAPVSITGTNINGNYNYSHNYAQGGDYEITIYSESDINYSAYDGAQSYLFYSGRTSSGNSNPQYLQCVKKIYFASNSILAKNPFAGMIRLENIVLANGVIKSSYNASSTFGGLQTVKHITIPPSLTFVNGAMYSLWSLETIVLSNTGVNETSTGLFNQSYKIKRICFPRNFTTMTQNICTQCSSLKEVYLPSEVTTINSGAFSSCYSFEKIGGASGVTTVGDSAFNGCTTLKSIELPNVTSIGNSVFSSCTVLKSVSLPKVETIGNQVFNYCQVLEYISMPKIQSIGQSLFASNYSIMEIELSEDITTLGSSAFSGSNSYQELDLSNCAITDIPSYAFSGSRFEKIKFPTLATTIGQGVCNSCQFTKEIILPPNITEIPSNMFVQCMWLTSIEIPSGVTSIGASAFNYCRNLKLIDFTNLLAVPTLANTNAFSNVNSSIKMVVPDSLYSDWITANNWTSYASKIVKESDYTG